MRVINITPDTRPATPWKDRWEFASPNGQWRLVFHTPHEFSMMATSWSVSLYQNGHDVSKAHAALTSLTRFMDPGTSSPWSADSGCLALATWDEALAFYEIHTARLQMRPVANLFPGPRWSPVNDVVLAISNGWATVLDRAGKQVCDTPLPATDPPFGSWWPSGEFLSIGRTSERAKIMLRLFDAKTAQITDSCPMDPADIVPYDAAQYAWVPRETFSLLLGKRNYGAGILLDRWESLTHEPGTSSFALAVERPTGEEPVMADGMKRLPVERTGVIVTCGA